MPLLASTQVYRTVTADPLGRLAGAPWNRYAIVPR